MPAAPHEIAPNLSIPELICELCRQFYHLGWVSGTGGGISIRGPEGIFMAPSGVQKERLRPEDIFLLDAAQIDAPDGECAILRGPSGLKVSECRPLFLNAYRLRGAGAVMHSHSLWAVLAARLAAPDGGPGEFVCRGLEMQKGLRGLGCFDTLRVPIIANTARESQLTASMAEAMQAYPDVDAVLVAGHGVYVWGADWVQAKTQAECYDYLFRAVVESHRLGLPLVAG
ncbi:MAG TPA: methylthioribulose 1-phosphate dehydratase [Nannocystis sp.]